jgi:hypothetical protein
MSRRSRSTDPDPSLDAIGLEATTPADRRRAIATGFGLGRIGVGALFFVNPVLSVRFLGVDGGTAARLDWLARMAAARDAAIGAGTLASARSGRGTSAWLLAGAACDAADAAVLGHALVKKRVSAVPAAGVVLFAAAGTVIAVAAVRPRRAGSSG